MDDGWIGMQAFTGGCQCGAVRYRVDAGRAFASICHCRMCQRATGSPFAALLEVDESRLHWQGTPKVFVSSNIADRGFCPACGTPLFYRPKGTGTICLTSGSLGRGVPFVPVKQWGTEGRAHWIVLPDMPGDETSETGVISHQAPE